MQLTNEKLFLTPRHSTLLRSAGWAHFLIPSSPSGSVVRNNSNWYKIILVYVGVSKGTLRRFQWKLRGDSMDAEGSVGTVCNFFCISFYGVQERSPRVCCPTSDVLFMFLLWRLLTSIHWPSLSSINYTKFLTAKLWEGISHRSVSCWRAASVVYEH